MKKTRSLKETLLQVAFFATILLFSSCGYNQNPSDTKPIGDEQNEPAFDTDMQEKDAKFIYSAAEANLKEIHLGQLAQQKGSVAHVKELGEMMETAHTILQNELIALARINAIIIPASPTEGAQEAYRELNEKSGNDFDRAYADMMVSGHKDSVAAFEEAAVESYDKGIKSWAINTLPDMRSHLEHSITCQRECDKKI